MPPATRGKGNYMNIQKTLFDFIGKDEADFNGDYLGVHVSYMRRHGKIYVYVDSFQITSITDIDFLDKYNDENYYNIAEIGHKVFEIVHNYYLLNTTC